jgi:hypothetical protein
MTDRKTAADFFGDKKHWTEEQTLRNAEYVEGTTPSGGDDLKMKFAALEDTREKELYETLAQRKQDREDYEKEQRELLDTRLKGKTPDELAQILRPR